LGYRFLEQQVRQGVGVVWISRPPANALDVELLEELHSVVGDNREGAKSNKGGSL
jgi:enoyl-CoA hydratase/carnithine racemase